MNSLPSHPISFSDVPQQIEVIYKCITGRVAMLPSESICAPFTPFKALMGRLRRHLRKLGWTFQRKVQTPLTDGSHVAWFRPVTAGVRMACSERLHPAEPMEHLTGTPGTGAPSTAEQRTEEAVLCGFFLNCGLLPWQHSEGE